MIEIVREPGCQNWTIWGKEGWQGDGGEGCGWGWEQIGFTFKVFLKTYISQIRMFTIAILLVGVLYGANLGPIFIFQLESCQKIEIQVIHSYAETFAYLLMSAIVNLVFLSKCKNILYLISV